MHQKVTNGQIAVSRASFENMQRVLPSAARTVTPFISCIRSSKRGTRHTQTSLYQMLPLFQEPHMFRVIVAQQSRRSSECLSRTSSTDTCRPSAIGCSKFQAGNGLHYCWSTYLLPTQKIRWLCASETYYDHTHGFSCSVWKQEMTFAQLNCDGSFISCIRSEKKSAMHSNAFEWNVFAVSRTVHASDGCCVAI